MASTYLHIDILTLHRRLAYILRVRTRCGHLSRVAEGTGPTTPQQPRRRLRVLPPTAEPRCLFLPDNREIKSLERPLGLATFPRSLWSIRARPRSGRACAGRVRRGAEDASTRRFGAVRRSPWRRRRRAGLSLAVSRPFMRLTSTPVARVLAAAGSAFFLAVIVLVVTQAPLGSKVFFAAVAVATAAYATLLGRVWHEPAVARTHLYTVFAIAVALRVPMAVAPVGPDSDMVRYQWDGARDGRLNTLTACCHRIRRCGTRTPIERCGCRAATIMTLSNLHSSIWPDVFLR